jgi:hypothetical protein
VNRFHHSKGRDEGLLKGSNRESPTHGSFNAKATSSNLQVPAKGHEPQYEDKEASDIYLTDVNDRFTQGTEMRL